MESPAAPSAQLTQQPARRAPATRHYRGIFRFPAVRQLIRFTGVGVICTAILAGTVRAVPAVG